MTALFVEYVRTAELRPYGRNARKHTKEQVKQVSSSIQNFGFTNPILAREDLTVIAGHCRLEAAKVLGLETVPVIRLAGLSDTQARTLMLADNKLALNASWDIEILASELEVLGDEGCDLGLTGFSMVEIDSVSSQIQIEDPGRRDDPEDESPHPDGPAVTRRGDLWLLGRHRLLCGDAGVQADYDALLQGEEVDLVFTDPPYNVPVDGHVSGLGRRRHREFAMAAGEMDQAQFTAFLQDTLGKAANFCRDGAIAFVCMDWRHSLELLTAGRTAFNELKNICVWNKSNAGMGAFYRSKHELVFVFKVGDAPHTNTFGLGDTGRYRTNVWDYPGINAWGKARDEALQMHPTVKPVSLVADAIKDCSKRADIVLDPFAGSGTTLIAAQSCGRSARLIEYDPLYCDTILRRYERQTGRQPTLATTGADLQTTETDRTSPPDDQQKIEQQEAR